MSTPPLVHIIIPIRSGGGNGNATSRPIDQNELGGQHSSIYLWEKTTFPADPNNIYILMVDLEAHPEADVNNPGTIDPS